ncbi:MAG: NUDIX hydrolase, partial [Pseudomonadota bacterium]
PVQAARRELYEEVHIKVDVNELKLVETFHSKIEYMDDYSTLYELNLSHPENFKCDNREVIWADFLNPKEALNQPLFPSVKAYLLKKSDSQTGIKI